MAVETRVNLAQRSGRHRRGRSFCRPSDRWFLYHSGTDGAAEGVLEGARRATGNTPSAARPPPRWGVIWSTIGR